MKAAHLQSPQMRRAVNITSNPIWRALNQRSMPATRQVDLALEANLALADVLRGHGTPADLDTIAVCANVSLVLAERGYGPENEPKIIEAQEAIVRTRSRAKKLTGRIGLDGLGMQALRDLLAIHHQQIAHATVADVSDATLEVRKRMAQGNVMRQDTEGGAKRTVATNFALAHKAKTAQYASNA